MAHNYSLQTVSSAATPEIAKHLDELFVLYMLEIESRYKGLSKHERIRIEQWVRN